MNPAAAVNAPRACAAAVNAAAAVNGTVKGVVFQDFGSTGFFTTGNAATGEPRNRPISGITAMAYDADGDLVGTATSGSNGTYTINVSGAKSNYLRIQFSGWDPSVYQPGFAAQTPIPANSQGENDTSVQFTELGTAEAAHVDLGLIIPDQVIQGNAPIATAIQYAGDPSNASTLSTDAALVAQPWSDYGASDDPAWPFNRVTLATFGQVGSIWGTAYIRQGNMMLASPAVKRMSGLGGTGGTRALGNIYRVNNVLNADGTLNPSSPAPTVWFNVEDLNVVDGGGTKVDLGTIATNADTWPRQPHHPRQGPRGLHQVGRRRHRWDGHLAGRPGHVHREPGTTSRYTAFPFRPTIRTQPPERHEDPDPGRRQPAALGAVHLPGPALPRVRGHRQQAWPVGVIRRPEGLRRVDPPR